MFGFGGSASPQISDTDPALYQHARGVDLKTTIPRWVTNPPRDLAHLFSGAKHHPDGPAAVVMSHDAADLLAGTGVDYQAYHISNAEHHGVLCTPYMPAASVRQHRHGNDNVDAANIVRGDDDIFVAEAVDPEHTMARATWIKFHLVIWQPSSGGSSSSSSSSSRRSTGRQKAAGGGGSEVQKKTTADYPSFMFPAGFDVNKEQAIIRVTAGKLFEKTAVRSVVTTDARGQQTTSLQETYALSDSLWSLMRSRVVASALVCLSASAIAAFFSCDAIRKRMRSCVHAADALVYNFARSKLVTYEGRDVNVLHARVETAWALLPRTPLQLHLNTVPEAWARLGRALFDQKRAQREREVAAATKNANANANNNNNGRPDTPPDTLQLAGMRDPLQLRSLRPLGWRDCFEQALTWNPLERETWIHLHWCLNNVTLLPAEAHQQSLLVPSDVFCIEETDSNEAGQVHEFGFEVTKEHAIYMLQSIAPAHVGKLRLADSGQGDGASSNNGAARPRHTPPQQHVSLSVLDAMFGSDNRGAGDDQLAATGLRAGRLFALRPPAAASRALFVRIMRVPTAASLVAVRATTAAVERSYVAAVSGPAATSSSGGAAGAMIPAAGQRATVAITMTPYYADATTAADARWAHFLQYGEAQEGTIVSYGGGAGGRIQQTSGPLAGSALAATGEVLKSGAASAALGGAAAALTHVVAMVLHFKSGKMAWRQMQVSDVIVAFCRGVGSSYAQLFSRLSSVGRSAPGFALVALFNTAVEVYINWEQLSAQTVFECLGRGVVQLINAIVPFSVAVTDVVRWGLSWWRGERNEFGEVTTFRYAMERAAVSAAVSIATTGALMAVSALFSPLGLLLAVPLAVYAVFKFTAWDDARRIREHYKLDDVHNVDTLRDRLLCWLRAPEQTVVASNDSPARAISDEASKQRVDMFQRVEAAKVNFVRYCQAQNWPSCLDDTTEKQILLFSFVAAWGCPYSNYADARAWYRDRSLAWFPRALAADAETPQKTRAWLAIKQGWDLLLEHRPWETMLMASPVRQDAAANVFQRDQQRAPEAPLLLNAVAVAAAAAAAGEEERLD